MQLTIALIISGILIILSGFHFYWLLGGRVGFAHAMPEHMRGVVTAEKARPSFKMATFIVGLGLAVFAIIILANAMYINLGFPDSYIMWAARIIGVIFLLRVMGDFKYAGLFKKKTDDPFAAMDTKVYIPLCLVVGLGSLLVTFL